MARGLARLRSWCGELVASWRSSRWSAAAAKVLDGTSVNEPDAGSMSEPPSPPPQVGTPACDMHPEDSGPNGVCVICSDGLWHCNLDVNPPCPTDIRQGASCEGWADPPGTFPPGICIAGCPSAGANAGAWMCSGPTMLAGGAGSIWSFQVHQAARDRPRRPPAPESDPLSNWRSSTCD
jgi:hypothetical protein